MSDIDRLEQRLAAVERAVVDGDFELSELADIASIAADVERLDSRLDEIERRVADVEGTAQSFGGYVAQVDSVNERVEQRANTAVATVDRLERRIDDLEQAATGSTDRPPQGSATARTSVDGQYATEDVAADDRPSAVEEPRDAMDADRTIDALMDDSSTDRASAETSQQQRATDGGQGESSSSSGWSLVADQQTIEETLASVEGSSSEVDGGAGEADDSANGTQIGSTTIDSDDDTDSDSETLLETIRSKFT